MTWMGEASGKGLQRHPEHTKEAAQVDWQKIANELEDEVAAAVRRAEAAEAKVSALELLAEELAREAARLRARAVTQWVHQRHQSVSVEHDDGTVETVHVIDVTIDGERVTDTYAGLAVAPPVPDGAQRHQPVADTDEDDAHTKGADAGE